MILILLFIMHSICPKFALISQIYLKFAIFVSFRQKFSSYFQTGTIFLSYPKGKYLLTMISGKNAACEAVGGVNEANICPKIAETG